MRPRAKKKCTPANSKHKRAKSDMRKIPLAKFFKVIITNKKSSKTFLLLDLFVKETKLITL